MKVILSEYRNDFTRYSVVKWLRYFFVSQNTLLELMDYVPNWVVSFLNLFVRPRKEYVHIDPHDVWSLDHTLALIIVPALRKLRSVKHGVPMDFVHDLDSEFFDQDNNKQLELFDCAAYRGISQARWDAAMDKMIWSFEQIIIENNDVYNLHYYDKLLVPRAVDDVLSDGEAFVETHTFNKLRYTLYEKRVQEGFDLFAKYYRSLWD